ncbi:hypothetical protein J6590_040090 [Homalodisca vitripennis]|nr:hypothetical protein J6590_040090 [Homalodisca vitripennis]
MNHYIGKCLNEDIQEALRFHGRCGCGKRRSPAFLNFGRELRLPLSFCRDTLDKRILMKRISLKEDPNISRRHDLPDASKAFAAKLAPRFVGPYTIISKEGKNIFQLKSDSGRLAKSGTGSSSSRGLLSETGCFDSLGGAHNRRIEQVKEFFENESLRHKHRFTNDQWSTLNTLGNTSQQNKVSNDCGIFVCLIADLLARENPIRSLRGLTSAELRDAARRKLKWTGVSIIKPEQRKKEAKLILRKVDIIHTTTASKNAEETLSSGNIFTPNEVDSATAYLKNILTSDRSPTTPSPY